VSPRVFSSVFIRVHSWLKVFPGGFRMSSTLRIEASRRKAQLAVSRHVRCA
jgi:hypothetical protein